MTQEKPQPQRFEVKYHVDDKASETRPFEQKGPAFAFGKRKARSNFGLRVEIVQFSSVPPKDVCKSDQKHGRRFWRPAAQWNIYPDGTVDAVRLT